MSCSQASGHQTARGTPKPTSAAPSLRSASRNPHVRCRHSWANVRTISTKSTTCGRSNRCRRAQTWPLRRRSHSRLPATRCRGHAPSPAHPASAAGCLARTCMCHATPCVACTPHQRCRRHMRDCRASITKHSTAAKAADLLRRSATPLSGVPAPQPSPMRSLATGRYAPPSPTAVATLATAALASVPARQQAQVEGMRAALMSQITVQDGRRPPGADPLRLIPDDGQSLEDSGRDMAWNQPTPEPAMTTGRASSRSGGALTSRSGPAGRHRVGSASARRPGSTRGLRLGRPGRGSVLSSTSYPRRLGTSRSTGAIAGRGSSAAKVINATVARHGASVIADVPPSPAAAVHASRRFGGRRLERAKLPYSRSPSVAAEMQHARASPRVVAARPDVAARPEVVHISQLPEEWQSIASRGQPSPLMPRATPRVTPRGTPRSGPRATPRAASAGPTRPRRALPVLDSGPASARPATGLPGDLRSMEQPRPRPLDVSTAPQQWVSNEDAEYDGLELATPGAGAVSTSRVNAPPELDESSRYKPPPTPQPRYDVAAEE